MTQDRDPIDIARAALELVARERDRLRPLAKGGESSRVERLRSEDHAELVEALSKLERYGVSHSDFARYIDRDRSRVSNWFLYGYTERCQIPGFVMRAVRQLLTETVCARVGSVANG